MIYKGDRFLICQRPPGKAREMLWEFVGGKVKPGETPREALIRECREELDIEVSPGSVFMDVHHQYEDIEVHLTLFNTTIVSGSPVAVEHSDLRWITAKEAALYDFCPADLPILRRLRDPDAKEG